MRPEIRRLAAGLPREPGVYRFRDARGRVLYVGRATELRARVGSYGGALRDRRHLRRMVPAVTRIEAVACDSVHEAAWLERNLLEESLPRWNRTAGGAEVPAYLRLDARPATAGLRLTHEAGPPVAGVWIFGPYLGGTRARLAVSALHRVHPLAATGSRLTGAERELAARRGFGATDREGLAEAVAAVLRRDPAAVAAARQELARVRDRAAAALAFELAGRVQEEIAALGWVTAAQQVTTLEPVDLAVQGWADGWLVSFAVRAGRIRTWSQRRSHRRRGRASPGATRSWPRRWLGSRSDDHVRVAGRLRQCRPRRAARRRFRVLPAGNRLGGPARPAQPGLGLRPPG